MLKPAISVARLLLAGSLSPPCSPAAVESDEGDLSGMHHDNSAATPRGEVSSNSSPVAMPPGGEGYEADESITFGSEGCFRPFNPNMRLPSYRKY